jgi:hypothetical protein
MMGPEARFEQACIRLAKRAGWRTVKVYAEPGFPDRMFLGPRGRIVFVEFKSDAGKLTRKQASWLRWLRTNKHRIGSVHGVRKGRRWDTAAFAKLLEKNK